MAINMAIRHMSEEYHILPDGVIDLNKPSRNDDSLTKHKHVVIKLDDGSEMWLDICTMNRDHNHVDIRWFNDQDELKGTGVFTIVNGRRMSLKPAYNAYGASCPDTEGRLVKGHGWPGGYVTTLLVDKNGEEETAIKPSPGNG